MDNEKLIIISVIALIAIISLVVFLIILRNKKSEMSSFCTLILNVCPKAQKSESKNIPLKKMILNYHTLTGLFQIKTERATKEETEIGLNGNTVIYI